MADSDDRAVPAPEPCENLREADLSQAATAPIDEDRQQASELAESESSQQAAIPVDASVSGAIALTPPGKRSRRTILMGAILLIVILLGGGSGLFVAVSVATRPQPAIRLASAYHVGSTSVGATGTIFHLSGQKFTANSAITFLLDGTVVAGNARTQSNDRGEFASMLTVTSAWPIGQHVITARDAAGSLTARSIAIMIVIPGQDMTPGPYGAPTDSASGTIAVTVNAPTSPTTLNLRVTGASNGGTVCASIDDGHQHTRTATSAKNALEYTETFSATCTGTYTSGRLTYTENMSKATITYGLSGPFGLICTLKKPYVANRLEGSFTSPTAISGTYASDPYTLRCTGISGGEICQLGPQKTIDCKPYIDMLTPAKTGTWIGVAAMQ